MRAIVLTIVALFVSAHLAFADPDLRVSYVNGVPRVQIAGDYSHATYTISRANRGNGPFTAITQQDVLCLGSCFADDRTAVPDVDYYYRFDLVLGDGTIERFGPYRVAYSRALLHVVGSRVYPNPGTGPTTIELFLAGESTLPGVRSDASLFDAQGRRVRQFFRGTLPRGLTSLAWDGMDDAGRPLHAGIYFLRFGSSLGNSVTRVLRAH
jgi:FlgD Ig-like domain